MQLRKNLKFALDPVLGIQTTRTGAPHQSTLTQSIVRDGNQESKEERGNLLSNEMGVGLGASGIDERNTDGENVFHSIGVETVEAIGPVYSRVELSLIS